MQIFNQKVELILNLYKSGNFPKAALECKDAINFYPKAVILYNFYGIILMNLGKIDESIDYLKKGLIVNSKYAPIYDNLGTAYKEKGNYSKALYYYEESIKLDSKSATTFNNLGNFFHVQNDNENAILNYIKATEINPNFSIAHYNAGVVFKNIGNFKKANKYLKNAINININFFTAHRIISQITNYTPNNDHLVTLKKVYDNGKILMKQKTELLFALGKAHEDLKSFNDSYKFYLQGNNNRRNELSFSAKKEKKEFNDIKKIFRPTFFKKFSKNLIKEKTPIFIVGMPRSGTTLVEQIISSHPLVFGGDELDYIPKIIEKNFSNIKNEISFNQIKNISNKDALKLSIAYSKKIKILSSTATNITDKLPINFKWIGLLKIMFPNAVIIHCKRNAKDNCFSIYKNYFTNRKLNFAYKINEIVDFYNLYSNLMHHWNKNLPNYIYDIQYEKLIENPEKEIKKLIKACNLSWNDLCLKFYDNKRPIKTASDTQARKKIYKTSLNSWKNYKKYFSKQFNKIVEKI